MPIWIHLFDDPELPFAIPLLQLFLTLDCIFHCMVVLVPNQLIDIVICGEAFEEFILVVPYTIPQPTCHSNVNRSTITAGHNVNSGVNFFRHMLRLAIFLRQAIPQPRHSREVGNPATDKFRWWLAGSPPSRG
jgi:hypothetical protein